MKDTTKWMKRQVTDQKKIFANACPTKDFYVDYVKNSQNSTFKKMQLDMGKRRSFTSENTDGK